MSYAKRRKKCTVIVYGYHYLIIIKKENIDQIRIFWGFPWINKTGLILYGLKQEENI